MKLLLHLVHCLLVLPLGNLYAVPPFPTSSSKTSVWTSNTGDDPNSIDFSYQPGMFFPESAPETMGLTPPDGAVTNENVLLQTMGLGDEVVLQNPKVKTRINFPNQGSVDLQTPNGAIYTNNMEQFPEMSDEIGNTNRGQAATRMDLTENEQESVERDSPNSAVYGNKVVQFPELNEEIGIINQGQEATMEFTKKEQENVELESIPGATFGDEYVQTPNLRSGILRKPNQTPIMDSSAPLPGSSDMKIHGLPFEEESVQIPGSGAVSVLTNLKEMAPIDLTEPLQGSMDLHSTSNGDISVKDVQNTKLRNEGFLRKQKTRMKFIKPRQETVMGAVLNKESVQSPELRDEAVWTQPNQRTVFNATKPKPDILSTSMTTGVKNEKDRYRTTAVKLQSSENSRPYQKESSLTGSLQPSKNYMAPSLHETPRFEPHGTSNTHDSRIEDINSQNEKYIGKLYLKNVDTSPDNGDIASIPNKTIHMISMTLGNITNSTTSNIELVEFDMTPNNTFPENQKEASFVISETLIYFLIAFIVIVIFVIIIISYAVKVMMKERRETYNLKI